jgi:DNA-binding response OmpR family regulator
MSVLDPALGRVLVVDDEVEVGKTLRDFLIMHGYTVKNAISGPDALRLAEIFLPDVVLLDILMPGMNGVEVLERLRVEHPSSRVIMLTANYDDHIARLTLTHGAFDYLPKPIDFDVLERVVAAAVSAKTPHDI